MQKEEIKEIAKIAAIEAIGHKDDVIREEFDTRYKDVKLLMRNYRKLKTYYSRVEPETLEVSSICAMRRKTGLMMSHVDKMLIAYQALCQGSVKPDEARRWEVLYLRYIADEQMRIRDIADKLEIDKRTFYRDLNKAMEDMAVLLFGIEAIGTWRHSTHPRQ